MSKKTNVNSANNTHGLCDVIPTHAKIQIPLQDVSQHSFTNLEIIRINNRDIYTNQIQELENILDIKIDPEDNLNLFVEAVSWIGTPYQHAGNTRNGIDCSGLSAAIYKNVYSIILDRRSDGQFYYNCNRIPINDIKSGDLVFFKINSNRISHVGVYLKNNKFIHASSYRGVVVNDLSEAYYKKYFYAAGRVK